MPKRLISDIAWKSKKVRSIEPPELRPEYAWLIPLANDHGVFEFDADSIWSDAYALARPGWDPKKVQQLLDELVRVKLVFKWEENDHTYGFFVGSDKPGLLPKPSERYSKGPRPDPAELARFTGVSPAGEPPSVSSNTANGIGNGSGSGSASAMDKALAVGIGSGAGTGPERSTHNEDQTPATQGTSKTSTEDTTSNKPAGQETKDKSSSKPTRGCNLYACERQETCTTPNCQCKCHVPPAAVKPPGRTESASGLTHDFYRLVLKNPNATDTPAHWERLWTGDIGELIRRYGYHDAQRIVVASQSERFAKYIVRGETLLKMSAEIATKLKIKPFNGIYPETDYSEVNIDDT